MKTVYIIEVKFPQDIRTEITDAAQGQSYDNRIKAQNDILAPYLTSLKSAINGKIGVEVNDDFNVSVEWDRLPRWIGSERPDEAKSVVFKSPEFSEKYIRAEFTGHLYYRSPYETCTDCGNCDGGKCDYCNEVWKDTDGNIYDVRKSELSLPAAWDLSAQDATEENDNVHLKGLPTELYDKLYNAFYAYCPNTDNQSAKDEYFRLVNETEVFARENMGINLSGYTPCDFCDKTVFYWKGPKSA